MQVQHLRFGNEFHVALQNARSQAATMVIPPGDSEGGEANFHRGADQWLYVVSGNGVAIVEGKSHDLRAGSLILIERGETHEIKNLGRTKMKTVNLFLQHTRFRAMPDPQANPASEKNVASRHLSQRSPRRICCRARDA